MKRILLLAPILLALASQVSGQIETPQLKIRAILVDKDLNQKPVPRLMLTLQRLDGVPGPETILKTGFDGMAEAKLPPGKYRLSTPRPIEFQGKQYAWEFEVLISGPEHTVELSNDNAKVSEAIVTGARSSTEDLGTLFRRLQKSVVTVWSEVGKGTGFLVDATGLFLTNQHVIGPSELIAVQFDEQTKVAAKLLAADPERDVAVLWANTSAYPDALAAPLARAETSAAPVAEGDRVFTIGSPLSQRKILTTGIVSKVERRAIISDININPGNSGGPLFTLSGYVIGITTFGEQRGGGPGISGIVRIEEALSLVKQANLKMKDLVPPDPRLLPVEPKDAYPLDAIKEVVQEEKFDTKHYVFGAGHYDVAVITPIIQYRLAFEGTIAAAKEKEKRTKKKPESITGTFRPLEDLRNWAEYAGQYKPIIIIQADPKLRETFWSAFGRGLAASGGHYPGPARMRFKTDFYKMRLLCGTKFVEPIQPVKVARVINEHSPFVSVTDATYTGLYSYPPDAISPACEQVSLELYSEKEPNKPTIKILDPKTVNRVWADFEPYRKVQAAPARTPDPAKN